MVRIKFALITYINLLLDKASVALQILRIMALKSVESDPNITAAENALKLAFTLELPEREIHNANYRRNRVSSVKTVSTKRNFRIKMFLA